MSQAGRRSDVTTEIVVGAFMFTILVALLTITVVISQNKFFEQTWKITAVFPNVGGLKEGENVFLRGVKVGNVQRIQVAEDEPGVQVDLLLTREVRLYEDYLLRVEPSSLLGGMRLIIEEGSRDLPRVPESNLMKLTGQPAPDLLGGAESLVSDLRAITSEIVAGRGTVGKLIQDDTLYTEAARLVDSLNRTASDLERVSADARVVSNRLVEGKGALGKLLGEDDTAYVTLTNTLEQLNLASQDVRSITKRVEAGEGTLGKLLSPDDQLYRDLQDTVAALKTFSEDLGKQQGTVGRLINEDTLYVKIEGLVDDARATIDDFRETSPITTFSTIFFGAF